MADYLSTIEKLKSSSVPVIIAGAGIVGKRLLSLCEREGIRVECFCDTSRKVAGTQVCGKKVLFTPELRKAYADATVIISVAAIKDVVDLLKENRFVSWVAGGMLLKDFDVSQASAALDYETFAVENCILCHEGYLHPGKLFVRSIDLIITERCSLKCKDCSNLMQYYAKPRDVELPLLVKSIDAFCKVVDEVMDFRLIGGDVFMNKDWPHVVKRLVEEPKARRVVLYTNGTLVPREADLPLLQNSKVLVIATDYGPLSRKLAELKALMETKRVAYHVLVATEWLDCAAIGPHNRGEQGNREIFKFCCAKNMATLSDGRVFRCPYAANAVRLAAVPEDPADYVDLCKRELTDDALPETKSRLREYLLQEDCLSICDYCNGRPLSGPEVKPAVQTKMPLPYRRYGKQLSD